MDGVDVRSSKSDHLYVLAKEMIMANKQSAIPNGPRAITPYLTIKGAAKGIDFYKRAFGAVETMRWTAPDGRIGHAEIEISGTPVFISDEHPEIEVLSPETLGGSPVGLHLMVEDADATFNRAVAAGAKEIRPVKDEEYGMRSGKVKDPFGHTWYIATQTKELSSEEMEKIGASAGYKTK
jgi:PhnB protein